MVVVEEFDESNSVMVKDQKSPAVFRFDTELYADSVECFPGLDLDNQGDAFIACGTYQLEENESGAGSIHKQNRCGRLYLFKSPYENPQKT